MSIEAREKAATRIEEIAARAEAATAGPWLNPHGEFVSQAKTFMAICRVNRPTVPDNAALKTVPSTRDMEQANIDFIAHARSDVPWLLDRVGFLRDLLLKLVDGTILPEEARYALQESEGQERAGSQVAEEQS